MTSHSYHAKLKIFPSGKSSLLYSYRPGVRTPIEKFQGCESPHALSVVPKFGEAENFGGTRQDKEWSESDSMIPGKGGLGKKPAMSWKSARQLKERMAACELEYGGRNCWFLTLTQPSVDTRAFEALARWSSYAMDRLNRQLKRYFGDSEFVRCSVWEYQKRGSLHCHMLLSSDCIHARDVDEFRAIIAKGWYRILGDIAKRFPCSPYLGSHGRVRSLSALMDINRGIHFVNCQPVKKSVVAYLSRYLSESSDGKTFEGKQALRKRFFPIATWAQWDRKASELYNKYYEEIDLGSCPNVSILSIESAIESLKQELPIKPDTEFRSPSNPYNHGIYFLFDRLDSSKRWEIKEAVRTHLHNLFDDSEQYRDWLSTHAKNPHRNPPPPQPSGELPLALADELALREASLTRRVGDRRMARDMGEYVAFLGVFVLELGRDMAALFESNPPPNYEQLELLNAEEKLRHPSIFPKSHL